MYRKTTVVLASISMALAAALAASSPAGAQSPFEVSHREILQKMEVMKARSAFAPNPLLAPQPTPNQLLYDVLHYALDITVDPTAHTVEGTVQATIASRSEALASIDFDAESVLSISSAKVVGGDPIAWSRAGSILTMTLPAALPRDDTVTIEVTYSGTPAAAANPGLFFTSTGSNPVVYSLSEPWSARTWWPCKDYPDDKATFDIRLAVPESFFAASNGTYLGYEPRTHAAQAYRSYHWQEQYQMATYLASITATVFTRLDDRFVYAPGETMLVSHYVYPSLVSKALVDLNITVPALQFFSSTFGLYPFIDEKYGVALCPIGGGMEHQTLTSYGASLITGTHAYDWVFVHELAHQWFGDMITCKNWVHIWLNEGFASYAEALWFEHLQGPERLKTYMESEDHPERWSGPILRSPTNTNPWYYFDTVVYDKASWVLHMLRHVMGDSSFFDALRAYAADPRYRFGAAETNDFRAICEAHAGVPLGWFFNEWLTRTDRLTYEWSEKSYTLEGAVNLTLTVDQMQDSLYTMPVDFRVTTSARVLDTVLCVDERHEEFHILFPAGETVAAVAFDPDHWVLCTKTEVATDVPVTPAALFLEQNAPNPFNPRTVIRFGLDAPGPARIDVFDLRGALVRTLGEGTYTAGIHTVEWDGENAAGAQVASGVYFYRLRSAAGSLTRKMVLLR